MGGPPSGGIATEPYSPYIRLNKPDQIQTPEDI
jgi:hypothetical protein